MSINAIETEIVNLVEEVTTVKDVYDYPVVPVSRNLPALIVLYDGIEQEHEAVKHTNTTYTFQFTLYYPAEGRTLETSWDKIKTVAEDILAKFRSNPTLNGSAWGSLITSGNTVIDVNGNDPEWLGHTFVLEATQTEG